MKLVIELFKVFKFCSTEIDYSKFVFPVRIYVTKHVLIKNDNEDLSNELKAFFDNLESTIQTEAKFDSDTNTLTVPKSVFVGVGLADFGVDFGHGKDKSVTTISKITDNGIETLYRDGFPAYVKMVGENEEEFTCLRLIGNLKDGFQYYRDAGDWSVEPKMQEDGTILSCSEIGTLGGYKLVQTTKEEWEKDNEGYINNSY